MAAGGGQGSTAATIWEVVGGGDKGGIVVRTGNDVASTMASERLSTGALVKELELAGERLHYERLTGTGPSVGWVSLRLQNGKDLMLRATGIWEVVGGEEKGGILVRQGKDTGSAQAPSRLSYRALVRKLELDGERLQFRRLTGSGPETGWVSTRLAGGKDLVLRVGADAADMGPVAKLLEALRDHHDSALALCQGIFEQLGDEDRKALAPELAKLAQNSGLQLDLKTRSVRRKAMRYLTQLGEAEPLAGLLADEDLGVRCEAALRLADIGAGACKPHIEKLADLLSDKEWRARCWAARALGRLGKAAVPSAPALRRALEDPDADVREDAAKALSALGQEVGGFLRDPHPEQVLRPRQPVAGRKPRILALHGTPSNSTVLQMQAGKLKATLGKEFEWCYVDSPMLWQDIPGSQDPLYMQPSDFEVQLAKGKPFLWWYAHGNSIYGRVEEGVANLRRLVEENQPVDVIVSFSQGSNCISLLLDILRREGAEVPWLLSVFFCGGQIDDVIYHFKEGWRSSQPTVRVFSSGDDAYFGGGEPSLAFMYSDLSEHGHLDGHGFPKTPPRATEIYAEVAREIRRHCGLPG